MTPGEEDKHLHSRGYDLTCKANYENFEGFQSF